MKSPVEIKMIYVKFRLDRDGDVLAFEPTKSPSRRGRHIRPDESKAGRYSRSYKHTGWGGK